MAEQETQEKIVRKGAQAEYVEKRSRFIANLLSVSSEEEAMAEIDRLRKEYYDARHNCYAYIVFSEDGKDRIERSSDDGEPSGTAGRPMLDVLAGNRLRNVLVVVTRYFGGVKLGPGGLVRAYGTAVKDAIDKSEFSAIRNGRKITVKLDYTTLGTIRHRMLDAEAEELDSTYDDGVSLTLVMPAENYERFRKELTQIFSGKEQVEDLGEVRYGKGNENIFLL
ncbi:MAG: YigZ family protein [Eubacterium sp.]|nr:YigZ family protein [Eubacterium sp.]